MMSPKVLLKWMIRQRELLLAVLIGLITLTVVDGLLVQGFYKDEKYRESLMVERLQAQVQSALEEHVTALVSLKVVYQNFVDISHYDFQQYGKSITANLTGFRRLFYIDPRHVIREVYPLTPENVGLIGYSLNQQPDIKALLKQAKPESEPVVSSLIRFLGDDKSVWAVIPIYRENHEFLGYAAGELSLENIWRPYGKKLEQYQLQLVDPHGRTLFQQVFIDSGSASLLKLPFTVGQQEWTLWLNPINPLSETLLIQRVSLWSAGVLILLLIVMMSIASRRHKSELEEAHQQFETIFEASPDGIMLLNDRLQPEICNPAVQSWLGTDHAALQGQGFFDLFACQCHHLNKCRELSYLLCTSGQFADDLPEVLETQIIQPKEGAPKTLRLNASRLRQESVNGKKQQGFICVLGDISTGKELERIKETYVATLTHDLKTPLLAQQMVLERLQTGNINAEHQKLLKGAQESVTDLLDMVNVNLLFYKIESTSLNLHRQKMPLEPLIKDVLQTLQPLAEKRDLTLELEASLGLPEVWIDPVQLKRVFHNLISNAMHYGKRGSPVRVRLQLQQGELFDVADQHFRIEICNEGKGIAPEELPKIFDKYFSLSRRFKQIGTGLGLYISRRLVEMHGGRIWAESEPDQETRFLILLPCTQAIEGAEVAADATSAS